MDWNFDEMPPREGTNSIKYDLRKDIFGDPDVIPMWVADMDFRTPDFIIEALRKRLGHEILGYTFREEEYFSSIMNWMSARHGWNIEKEWICFSPGVVPALNMCTLALTQPGETVVVQPPVYFPFFSAVESHGRKLAFNGLLESDGRWLMNTAGLENISGSRPSMIFLSNPHNPVGRVWSEDELRALADICLKNNIIIVSDEIHCDLVMPGYRHTPVAGISDEIADITVTCIAPSKTFNLAGLSTSSVIISNPALRKSFISMLEKLHIGGGNIFGNIASSAAYKDGEAWLDNLVTYIDKNAQMVSEFFRSRHPEIIPSELEATYLMWLDCRKLGMNGRDLHRFFIREAGIGMNEGSTFGPGGEGFMRMNIACPRPTIQKALEKIDAALASIS